MSKFLPPPRGYRKKILHQSENVEISRLEKKSYTSLWVVLVLIVTVSILIYLDVLNVTIINNGNQIFTTDN